MKEVSDSEDTLSAVDEEQDQSFDKDVSSSGIGACRNDRFIVEVSDSSFENKRARKKTTGSKKKKKRKKHSSDSEEEIYIRPRPRRSCTLASNGYSVGSLRDGVSNFGLEWRRPSRTVTTMRKSEDNARGGIVSKTSQKNSKSGGSGDGVGGEDDINITVKGIKLQSAKRRSTDSETATSTKKIKPDLDAANYTDERIIGSQGNCTPSTRKLVVPYSSDDSDVEKEDLDMMNAAPFSGVSDEGKLLHGCVAGEEDKLFTPLCKSSLPEKVPSKRKGPKPNGIHVVSHDTKKTSSSPQSPRSTSSAPKQRGRPKTNTGGEASGKAASDRLRECSTSKPARSTKRIPGEKPIITEKQRLRNKVKEFLLNAGWTIELKPRRGRAYEDSVYVSPEGKGYWSITKAYNIYQQKLKLNETHETGDADTCKPADDNGTDPDQSEMKPLVTELPKFDLSILKRNVVNKRRSKEELDLIRKSGNHTGKKKGRNTKKSTDKKNGFIVPRSCSSNSNVEDHLSAGRKRKNKRGSGLSVRESSQDPNLDTEYYIPYAGKRTVLGWLVDSGTLPIDGNVKYVGETQKVPLEGRIKQDGIQCKCCDQIFTASSFEIHAGSDLCRPFDNIFVEDLGLSLLDCQLKAWQNQEESVRCGHYSVDIDDDPNDDTCGICGDGGELICCDSCPSTYHLGCLGMETLPPGDWHCSYCICVYCGTADCSITEGDDDNFHLLACGLCERKYHRSCFQIDDGAAVSASDIDSYFCGQNCSLIFIQLQKLLGIKNNLEDGFSWSLIQRVDDSIILEPPVKANCNANIAVALAVMDECFLPILDQRSGVNLIQNVVYNFRSNFNRLNYSGFYTFILERDDEIIAAASVRIHGKLLAEMPFIGTRSMYRRQGMCRRLLTAIETTLSSFGVERLLIPAISELEETWTKIFNFRHLDDSFNQQVKSINLMVFPGTGLLEKRIMKHEKAEVACEASGTAETEVVKDGAPAVNEESPVAQHPANGIRIPPVESGFMVLDKDSSFKTAGTLYDKADVSSNNFIKKDPTKMIGKEFTQFDLAASSDSPTDATDGCLSMNCNCPEPFDSSNLPDYKGLSTRNPLNEGCCGATSLDMPHASGSENGCCVSLNSTH